MIMPSTAEVQDSFERWWKDSAPPDIKTMPALRMTANAAWLAAHACCFTIWGKRIDALLGKETKDGKNQSKDEARPEHEAQACLQALQSDIPESPTPN